MPNPSHAEGDIPVVLTKGLTKVFKDFWMRSRVVAVDHLDLEIHQGEIFGLLGPNGSGKSTTIKVLLGLLHKTSGFVAVFGKPPADVNVKKRIGVLPEESYLYPFLNAFETLDYYGKLFGLHHHDRKRRIEELLDMVGLTAVARRQVREYSKGMQRRIGLAQALINDPELLILDEPTAGLDPIGAKQVRDLIVELGRRGKTVLLSSHQLADVEDCVDRLLILYGGKSRAEGTCDELLTARSRMTIETDVIDERVVGDIDKLLRAQAGVAIRRVSKPRQRLEDLFLNIVEQARDEKLQTHGAEHGGATATFLLGDEKAGPTGDRLIQRLVASGQGATDEESPPAQAPPSPAQPHQGVIETLVSDSQRADEDIAPASSQDDQASAEPPDLGVIESLLDAEGSDRQDEDDNGSDPA